MLLSKLVAEATLARRATCFREFIEVRAAETREFVVKRHLDVLLRGRERELRNTHGSDVSVEGFCRKIGFTVKNFHNRFPKLARVCQERDNCVFSANSDLEVEVEKHRPIQLYDKVNLDSYLLLRVIITQ